MPVLTNAKHELFAQETAKGVSGAEAYRAAGYAANANAAAVNANRLLKTAKVRARVDELLAQRQNMDIKATEIAIERLALDKEWVIGRLMENVERSMQYEEVKDTKGGGTGEYRYDGSVANRALELLGKHMGMFKDKIEHSGPDGGEIKQVTRIERVIVRSTNQDGRGVPPAT